MRIIRIILSILLTIPLGIFFSTPIKAQQNYLVNKNYYREYVVKDDFIEITEVKETLITDASWIIPGPTKEFFTIFNPDPNDPNSSEKLNKTKESIQITDQFGNILDFQEEESKNKNNIISVNIPNNISFNQPSKITLKYNSYALSINSGKVKDIYIPGLPSDYEFTSNQSIETITTKVIIDEKYPEINFISPLSNVNNEGTTRIVEINQQDLLGQMTWIQLGIKQQFRFSIKQKVPSTSFLPFGTNVVTIPIPRDTKSGAIDQNVYFEKIKPQPSFVGLDIDGNLIASFQFSPNEEGLIEIEGYGILEQNQNFDITKSGNIEDIPSEAEIFLPEGKYWEVNNPKIVEEAKALKGDEKNIYKIVKKTFDYVVERIDYSFVKKYGLNERQGALKTLKGGAAVCMEYSDLFITLLRAQGIPARAAFGHGFSALEYSSLEEKSINHQWAEVYFPSSKRWVSFDTTWGEFGSDIVGGDLNHFFSHVASIDPETPSPMSFSYIGNASTIEQMQYVVEVDTKSEEEIKKLISQNQLLDSFRNRSQFEINLIRRPEQLLVVTAVIVIILIVNYIRLTKNKEMKA